MKFEKFLKMAAPMVALAVVAGMTSGCNGEFKINDSDGVPLSELDLAGKAPDKLVLMGSDTIRVTAGDALKIELEGSEEAKAQLRFVLDSNSLGVLRENGFGSDGGAVTVHVTMPAPREIVVGGSGTVHTDALAKDAEISIAGSGSTTFASDGEVRAQGPSATLDRTEVVVEDGELRIRPRKDKRWKDEWPNYEAATFEVTLPRMVAASTVGSGAMTVDRIAGDDFAGSVAGSGMLDLADLAADDAKLSVSVAGSGDAALTVTGEAQVSIVGSGDVEVAGSARCAVSRIGSGKVSCASTDRETEISLR